MGSSIFDLLRGAYRYPFIDAKEWLKQAVWAKGRIAYGYDQWDWRVDVYGSLMMYAAHGNTDSAFGWEIDHITSVARGGSDDLWNLQPLHWRNNRAKGDS